MALYTTFGELQQMLRSECGLSTNPAIGVSANDRHKNALNRAYAILYDDYDWPHLRYETPRTALNAGQRFYDVPAGVNYNAIEQFIVWWADEPYTLAPGIGAEEYAAFDNTLTERADPPMKYAFRSTAAGTTQIEIWPTPAATDMTFQIIGKRAWAKLVNSIDIALLDDHMIVLSAAADILSSKDRAAAEEKRAAANQRRTQLRARSVLPQSLTGADAPGVGTGGATVGLRGNKAVVRIGRG